MFAPHEYTKLIRLLESPGAVDISGRRRRMVIDALYRASGVERSAPTFNLTFAQTLLLSAIKEKVAVGGLLMPVEKAGQDVDVLRNYDLIRVDIDEDHPHLLMLNVTPTGANLK